MLEKPKPQSRQNIHPAQNPTTRKQVKAVPATGRLDKIVAVAHPKQNRKKSESDHHLDESAQQRPTRCQSIVTERKLGISRRFRQTRISPPARLESQPPRSSRELPV